MSMETTAWTQLHSVMNAERERRPFSRVTLRRIAAFARPHRRRIALFVVLGVLTAIYRLWNDRSAAVTDPGPMQATAA